ncbi:MAG: polysaccharide deacetylase family protein [Clostridia bacterium]|nr:polysaccharide deacetylase family protein [Clostridia bacterium]
MYIIKMKTIIYYLAIFAVSLASIGIIRLYSTNQPDASTIKVSEEASPTEVSESFGTRTDEVEVPIIMYHNIHKANESDSKYVISEADFENDLKFLSDNGYTTVVMQDLINFVQGKSSLPKKPVVLTFDDGYFNNCAYGFPLLQKYNSKAVISIIGYYTDQFTQSPDENPKYSHLTWDDIKELMKSGNIEFQNHSYNLHTTDKGRNGSKKKRSETLEEYKQLLTSDLQKLQEEFTQNTGYTPTTFTYPFGSVSEASFDIIKELGFQATLSCENKTNFLTHDPECLYMLNRFIRTPSVSVKDILH